MMRVSTIEPCVEPNDTLQQGKARDVAEEQEAEPATRDTRHVTKQHEFRGEQVVLDTDKCTCMHALESGL